MEKLLYMNFIILPSSKRKMMDAFTQIKILPSLNNKKINKKEEYIKYLDS